MDPTNHAIHAAVTIRLAQPAALIPMKLRAAEARPRSNEKKKASDGLDAYTVLDRLDVDGALATAVAQAPWDIPSLTEAYLRRGFLENANVTAGRINRWMNLTVVIEPADLHRVAKRFLRRLG